MTPTTQYMDDIELPEDMATQERVSVMRIADVAFQLPPERMQAKRKERGQTIYPMFHIDWEPLSFKYDFNPAVFTDNPNNYEQQWVTMMSNDGKTLGGKTQFGQLFEAFKALGYPLTKNSVFRPLLVGKIFKVRSFNEPYTDANGVKRDSWNLVPVEELTEYTGPATPQVFKRGYGGSGGGSGGVSRNEPTAEAIAALKEAINGKTEDEYADALFDSGNPIIMCDPFMAEAADKDALTARLTALGGKVISGRVFFEEVTA
jgi:hypothetical protein